MAAHAKPKGKIRPTPKGFCLCGCSQKKTGPNAWKRRFIAGHSFLTPRFKDIFGYQPPKRAGRSK